jgi:TRAP-type uncharacterized transport system substrate-binding protein
MGPVSILPSDVPKNCKSRVTVEVRATASSVRILKQASSGVVVAIVQSGVASPVEIEGYHALGGLSREPSWVCYRGEKLLDRLSQLEGKPKGAGPPGSGTHAIAMRLLAANGLIEVHHDARRLEEISRFAGDRASGCLRRRAAEVRGGVLSII